MYRNLEFNSLENEIWKSIPSFENKYEVSNLGRVKTLINKRIDKNGIIYSKKPKILKQSFTSTGYLQVTLQHKKYKVHRLVAMAFIPKQLNKNIINHKDFNRLNNKVENLEWCTPKENVEHAVLNKRNKKYYYYDKDEAIELFEKGIDSKIISEILKVPRSSILNLLHNKNIKRSKSERIGKYNVTPNKIRTLINRGLSNKEICEKYNISSNYVSVLKYQMKLKGGV